MLRIVTLLLFGLTPALAAATDLEATARQFDHPDRYRVLFSRLIDRGVHPERIQALFTSEKAARRDEKAVRLRTDTSEIPKHKEREREANKRYVYEANLLVDSFREHGPAYERMEKEYGIRKEIIGAILLKESALGRYDGFDHDAFTVFNSLLDGLTVGPNAPRRLQRRIPRLLDMAEEQLVSLVLYAQRQGFDLADTPVRASYAGAVGIPQFLPSNLDHAVSAGEGPPDLSRLPDAILSAANLLRNKFDWPDRMLDFQRLENLGEIVEAWLEFDEGNASFAAATNADGQRLRRFDKVRSDIPNISYVATYVRAIMRYNYSSDYALGVLQIAERAHRLQEKPQEG
ncbi:MAG: lytic murein transglycosylase [Thiohalorhabdus sp.]|uniref:lytic murein transglycosylase n=1 Tax=Thiohalorhabdus sp. TaxID=3094134 RepID=UPI003980F25D